MDFTKPIYVTLTPEEVSVTLDFVARMREDKITHKVRDKMFDINNTSEGINILGHLGEMAAGRVLNLPVDTEVRTGGDAGYDLTLDGQTIQVKTSTLKSLIFNASHLFTADLAILVQFIGQDKKEAEKDPRFIVHGWIDKEQFLDIHYKKNFGYGVRLVVDSNKLSPLDSLINKMEYKNGN
jgi:hypothetical protein